MISINRNRGSRLLWCAALALTPLLIGLAGHSVSVASAGTKKPSNKMTGDKDSPAKPDVDQTARLALCGEQTRLPILMLATAELLSRLRERKAQSTTTKSEDAKLKPQGASKKRAGELTIANLVKKALEFTRGDKQLTTLVKKRADRPSSRGLVASQGAAKTSIRVKGTTFKIISQGYIRPGERITIGNVWFAGRRSARIIIVGDGNLDLSIYDGNSGVLIRRDTGRGSVRDTRWIPWFTGPFKVVVGNVGRATGRYYVLANR